MNEIVKIPDVNESSLVSHFGSNDNFQWLMERQAEIYQVPMSAVNAFPDVRGALVKATQMSWTYGVMPGKHIYMIPFNKKVDNQWRETYAVADSYEWRKASADDKAQENGWVYMVQSERMTPAEVEEYITANKIAGPYDPTDRGVRSRVLFRHEAEICQMIGVKYDPCWHYGFWRCNAQERTDYKTKKKVWASDNVPSGRTPDWVAMKRAEKSALAQHFELRPLGGWSQKNDSQRRAAITDHVTHLLPDDLPNRDHMLIDRSAPADDEFFGWDDGDAGDEIIEAEPLNADEIAAKKVGEWLKADNVAESAKNWAVEIGAQPNIHAAKNSLAKIIQGNFSGEFSTGNAREVLTAFYFRQQQKLTTQLDAISVADADPIPA